MSEEWRDVPGYEGFYQVSNKGRVRSVDRFITQSNGVRRLYKGKIIAPFDQKGYDSVMLWRNRQNRAITVHRLVALAFIGPCPKGHQVNHKSGNKRENHPGNLEYVTPRRNLLHAIENGFMKSWKGKKNPRSRLQPDDVRQIRKLHATGDYYLRELAERYGVTIQSIWAIVKRKTWKHIS